MMATVELRRSSARACNVLAVTVTKLTCSETEQHQEEVSWHGCYLSPTPPEVEGIRIVRLAAFKETVHPVVVERFRRPSHRIHFACARAVP